MKRCTLLLFVLISVLPLSNINSQSNQQALIFTIDVSKSMLNPSGFYNTLKENIKTFIKNDVQVNDLVTIYSFGDDVKIISDVPNFKITGAQDIERLAQSIDKLKPSDNFTFLTKAIDIMATQMESLQSQYKNMPIKAFLFTDGKNEPPTGSTSLTLDEILNKHNATFKNPYTYTYLITLGTKLDKELEARAADTESGIQVSPGDKSLVKRSLNIIPAYQKVEIGSSTNYSINANFQFLSIKNIPKGSIKFTSGTHTNVSLESSENEVDFTSSSIGTKFNLPIKLSVVPEPGKFELKYQITPVDDNYEVIPREVTIELKVQVASVEIATDKLEVESTTKGGLSKVFIKGENKSSNEIKVLPVLDPVDQNISYNDNYFSISPGKFEKEIEFRINPLAVGEYPYSVMFQAVDSDVKIEKKVDLLLKITNPFNWGPIIRIIIIILVLALLFGIVYIYFYLINKEFAHYSISGMGLQKEVLGEFKKFWSTQLTVGTDIFSDSIATKVLTIKADIKTPFDKKLKLKWHDKDNTSPNEIMNYESLQSMKVNYNNKNFEFEKN